MSEAELSRLHEVGPGPETVLIATFQRLSLMRQEATRYALLAPKFARVLVFGVPDVLLNPISGIKMLPIESSWPLVQEWCVIASGPSFCAALLSRDVEGFQPDRRSRHFAGRWTTDLTEVNIALQRVYTALGQIPPTAGRVVSA